MEGRQSRNRGFYARPRTADEPAAAARPAPASGAKPVWSILDEISQPRCAAKEAEEDVENVPPPVSLPPLLRQETAGDWSAVLRQLDAVLRRA